MNQITAQRKAPTRLLSTAIALSCALSISTQINAYEIDPDSTVASSPTTLIGVNHIGLSVRDLDASLEFYQQASGFKLIRRETVRVNRAADKLFGHENIEYEIAVLEAPNMLFELTEFSHNRDVPLTTMPVEGPGMTHTCFQSPKSISGYDKFKATGADILSWGDAAIDLLGQGVTYAYGYDPEGNMFEMEQLDFEMMGYDPRTPDWIENEYDMWMTQVALVTHDIERLTDYYAKIMAFPAYREAVIPAGRPTFDAVAGVENVEILATWFRMSPRNKTMEFWQYLNPVTEPLAGPVDTTALGYSYSIEVGDIQAEYARMEDLGVDFISEPVLLDGTWQVYANDIDGNVFSLRQYVDANSPLSVPQLEL